jgi:hypothetical protein
MTHKYYNTYISYLFGPIIYKFGHLDTLIFSAVLLTYFVWVPGSNPDSHFHEELLFWRCPKAEINVFNYDQGARGNNHDHFLVETMRRTNLEFRPWTLR